MTPDTNEHSAIRPDHQLPPHEAPVRRQSYWLFILIAVLLILGIIVWHFYSQSKDNAAKAATARPAPNVNITVAIAQKGNIGVYLESIGTVTPVYTDAITSQVNGLVTAVHFREGQRVNKGDALIDIDSRQYRATLLQAQGMLDRDENVLGQARMDQARYEAAWKRNAIAKQVLDDQEKLVLQDEGTVKNDQGTVQFDEVQVDYCSIKSPISGKVGLRLVDPGNVVTASGNVTLAVITQMEPITVIFTIPEDSLGPVEARLRTNAKLAVDAFDRSAQSKIATGTLITIDNQIDTTTGTVKGRAVFDNKSDSLFPNQFVNTRLLVNTLQGITLVPSSTIQQNGQASFVYVIQSNTAHMRPVKPGVTDGGLTQVDSVNPGDVVANSSFDKLQDNVAVTVVAPPSQNGAPAQNAAPTQNAAPAQNGTTGKNGASRRTNTP